MSQNAIKTEARVRNLIDILGALALESFVSLRALNDGDPTMALDLILGGTRSHKTSRFVLLQEMARCGARALTCPM